jgi:recombination protein RecA
MRPLPIRGQRSPPAADYFIANKGVKFISSGCELLDCALGGGYAQARVINIVGDKSTGKTLLVIEVCANFALSVPKGMIRYKEAEAAFDKNYARVLGAPLDRMEFEEEFDTVEELEKDVTDFCARVTKKRVPGLYIVDSLDALSDKAELKRDIEKGTYGASKAKLMSEFFRRNKRKLQKAKVTLVIVSQVRDKINVAFGRKWSRSGGKALDFYASQVVYLAEVKKLYRTVRGVRRAYGVVIRAKITKNKVGIPFREVEFSLIFGYGIDDVLASLAWLKSVEELKVVGLKAGCSVLQEARKIKRLPTKRRKKRMEEIKQAVHDIWIAIEMDFLPKETKY